MFTRLMKQIMFHVLVGIHMSPSRQEETSELLHQSGRTDEK